MFRTLFTSVLTVQLLVALHTPGSFAKLPSDFPPLPQPPSEGGKVVWVAAGDSSDLAQKIKSLVSGTTLVIPAGHYQVNGRLSIGDYANTEIISNIVIRGATGNPEDVVLHGYGMLDEQAQ